ncbi:helix-turn-helix transcriptional regulator [Novosphingobium sp. 9]|uniref:helix-turn-helix transcriptional regulator n=1 Tax=Novosphingobium sp. 9 TaxID=2025349 RepID=UPI0021B56B19|nr:helix-turn-helix transcriptional regulator [Novosphingobium sp. 9]
MPDSTSLGTFLRDRRERMDPQDFGFPAGRRRTPGLRREELAQLANISATWYTWLEQGRGGAPSADVLDRLARAMLLTDVEREHLFLVALGHAPDVRVKAVEDPQGVTQRLQGVLDALDPAPAMIKNALWDIIAWNRAASVVLTDYATIPPRDRNVLRMMFRDDRVRGHQENWESVARMVVAVFRADVARAGAQDRAQALVDEMCETSAEFRRLWHDRDVSAFGGGIKRIRHAELGELALEFSGFAVDGRTDLAMIVYNPVDPADRDRIRQLCASRATEKVLESVA